MNTSTVSSKTLLLTYWIINYASGMKYLTCCCCGLSKFRMQIFFKIYCKWQDRILSSKTEWLCQQNAFKIELWTKVRKKVSGHFNKSKIMLRNLIFDNNNKLFNSLNRPFNNAEYIFAWLHILVLNPRIMRVLSRWEEI